MKLAWLIYHNLPKNSLNFSFQLMIQGVNMAIIVICRTNGSIYTCKVFRIVLSLLSIVGIATNKNNKMIRQINLIKMKLNPMIQNKKMVVIKMMVNN